jgi:hypothetical protein
MKILKVRHVTMGLTLIPFVFLGWVFTSWLAATTLPENERKTLNVIDQPQKFYSVASFLSFKVATKPALK